MSALTPLLEIERTFVGRAENAAFDPNPVFEGREIPQRSEPLT
jgi:hypothetical protein